MPTINKFVPAPNNGSISVTVNYPGASNKFQIVSNANKISDIDLIQAISRPTDGDYKIARLLAEFKPEEAG